MSTYLDYLDKVFKMVSDAMKPAPEPEEVVCKCGGIEYVKRWVGDEVFEFCRDCGRQKVES